MVRDSAQAKRHTYWQQEAGPVCMEMLRAEGRGWDTENIYKTRENDTFSISLIEGL